MNASPRRACAYMQKGETHLGHFLVFLFFFFLIFLVVIVVLGHGLILDALALALVVECGLGAAVGGSLGL